MDLREIILARLKQVKRPRSWLARAQRVVHWRSAEAYLRGSRDASGATIGAMLKILGLGVKRVGRIRGNAKLQSRE